MMKYYLNIILLITLFFVTQDAFAVQRFQNERLRYVIFYKWGLIHKDAGEATLSLKTQGNNYNIQLTAKTKPWADRIYQVRDTLKGVLRASDLKPLSYKKITHEKGEYKLDEISYSFSGNTTTAKAKRYRYKKGKPTVTENSFSANGPVYDMLSVFYYIRQLDFANFSNNKTYTATVFSGRKKETIKIRCLGKEKIKLKDKTEREAYHIKFSFTQNGGKKSSDDMETWISTDARHIPLYLVGKLPVGEVRAYFLGG